MNIVQRCIYLTFGKSLKGDSDKHLSDDPFLIASFYSKDITIVPVLVGALTEDREAFYGGILAPYLNSPDTFFVISSDFCHWQVQKNVLHYSDLIYFFFGLGELDSHILTIIQSQRQALHPVYYCRVPHLRQLHTLFTNLSLDLIMKPQIFSLYLLQRQQMRLDNSPNITLGQKIQFVEDILSEYFQVLYLVWKNLITVSSRL